MGADYSAEVYLGIPLTEDDLTHEVQVPYKVNVVTSCPHGAQSHGHQFCPKCGTLLRWEKQTRTRTERRWKPQAAKLLDLDPNEDVDFDDWLRSGYETRMGACTIYAVQAGEGRERQYVLGHKLAGIGSNPCGDPISLSEHQWASARDSVRALADSLGINKRIWQTMLLSAWA